MGRGEVATFTGLAALFKKYAAAIEGKHPVTKAQIEEAATVGSALQVLLEPTRARSAQRPADVKQAVDDRDRLWTLLVQGHEKLWRAGAYLFGQAGVDQAVPALMAHQGTKHKTPSKKVTPPASSGTTA